MANTATGAIAQTFTFSAHALRVIMRDGNPWFVASDVCAAIGIQRTSDAVEKLDADEKGTDSIRTLGGSQEMLIVNESGLNAIILRSRDAMTPGTPSHKYRKWVTAEVLPAIRKTGRYVAPNAPQATTPPPAMQAERLNGSDMLNLKRRLHYCIHLFQYESSWSQGLWYYLRTVLGLPSPQPFTVEHLPVLSAELQRIHAITYQVQDIIREIEAQAIKRIFRKGESAELVLADIKRQADADMAQITDGIAKMPGHFQGDHINLLTRAPHFAGINYGVDEQVGYFEKSTLQ